MGQRHRASSDARDQAHSFDAPDGVIRRSGEERNVHLHPANLPKSGECRITHKKGLKNILLRRSRTKELVLNQDSKGGPL